MFWLSILLFLSSFSIALALTKRTSKTKKNLSLISSDGTMKRMTSKEAELLNYFARHANQLIKRSQLLIDVWGNDDYFLGRSMDVFISRLRKYLAADARIKIEAIHGVGFQFICPE